MPFSLKKQASKIAHLNVREENHGDDPVLAVDVKVQADVGNEFLDQLSPGLRAALYQKEGAVAGETPDIDAEHLGSLRFLQLQPFEWKDEMLGAKVVIHGHSKAENIDLEGDVNQIRLACKEGGTVELTYRVQVQPTPEDSGRLAAVLGRKVKVSVAPAALSSMPSAGTE